MEIDEISQSNGSPEQPIGQLLYTLLLVVKCRTEQNVLAWHPQANCPQY